jgi:calcineurin-like phosphoesterase family protein
VRFVVLVSLAGVALAGCGGGSPTAVGPSGSGSTTPPPAPVHASRSDPAIAAAGDIACPPGRPITAGECHQAATAALLARVRPTAVLPIGDDQYETGGLVAFRSAYGPTWGRFDAIVRPVPGNHEYARDNGTGYYAYYGARAGYPARGYYSYDLGAWHLIGLNSNCSVVSCAASSAQVRWLRADLAAHRRRCTLAYWHHPRFSSGPHGNQQPVAPLWRALYSAGADVVLNGHDHDYERFAPQTPAGRADARHGIREFVVGTGGRSHYPTLIPRANSQRRNSSTFGVLALTLHRDGYSWRFVPEAGGRFTDRGTGPCH